MSALDVKALSIFIKSLVTQDMIHKLVVATLQVLPCEQDTKVATITGANGKVRSLPSLMTFLTKLVRYTNVYAGTLMATLVYLNRLKNRLPKNAQGLPCTRHRILLSCLILSSKFHNDCSPKNIHWAKYTDGLFSVQDINLMERQLSFLLNWDLKVTNEQMVDQLDSFLQPIKEDLINSAKVRKFLQKQQLQQKQKLQQQQQQQQQQHLHASPSITRSSSNSSTLSLHYRNPSTSSNESFLDSSPEIMPVSQKVYHSQGMAPTLVQNQIDPVIEMTALKEEQGLSQMIQQLTAVRR